MLCNSCLRQRVCITRKLALSDRALLPMLETLQQCELRIVRSVQPKPRLSEWIKALMKRHSARLLFAAKQPK